MHSRTGPVETLSSHKYRQEIGGYSKPTGGWNPRAMVPSEISKAESSRDMYINRAALLSLSFPLLLSGAAAANPRRRRSTERAILEP